MAKSKGSWTFGEIQSILMNQPNEVPLMTPISEKVERGISSLVTYDLYPFVMEIISLDGFISKKLALNFTSWIVGNKETWQPDPDKLLSLRRERVNRFCNLVAKHYVDRSVEFGMDGASKIAARCEGYKHWDLTREQFSSVIMYIARTKSIPLFGVMSGLCDVALTGYNVHAATRSICVWVAESDPPGKQLSLL